MTFAGRAIGQTGVPISLACFSVQLPSFQIQLTYFPIPLKNCNVSDSNPASRCLNSANLFPNSDYRFPSSAHLKKKKQVDEWENQLAEPGNISDLTNQIVNNIIF